MSQDQQQDFMDQSTASLDTQIEEYEEEVVKPLPKNIAEVEKLLKIREDLKSKMKTSCKKQCCGKDEYISFDNHINLLDVSHYKKFMWPTCKEGLQLNKQMNEVCKKLWKLNFRDYLNYLQATYIFV